MNRTDWISTADRLPDDGERVYVLAVNVPDSITSAFDRDGNPLAEFENRNPGKGFAGRPVYSMGTYHSTGYWVLDVFPEWRKAQVSHWQPRPALPEVFNLDWDEVLEKLHYMHCEYLSLGTTGVFALSLVIRPLMQRVDRGERTQQLYDAIMELKE